MTFETYKLIAILRNLVSYHSRLYYNDARTELSDADFDRLYSKLEALEAQWPESLIVDSPTQKVGGGVSLGFTKIKHLTPMLSLTKTPIEKLDEWDKKMRLLLS